MSEYGYDPETDTPDGVATAAPPASDPGSVAPAANTAAQPASTADVGHMDAPTAGTPYAPQSASGSLKGFYQVQSDDTSLDVVAFKLGLSSPYHDLFQPNMAEFEAAARGAGYPGGSDQGTILIPGTWLEVPLSALSYYQEHQSSPS